MTEKIRRRNRKNARHSTGPRTEAGKKASSQNARKRGIRSLARVLPGEDEADIDHLERELFDQENPVGPSEIMCVERIFRGELQRRRAERAVDEILCAEMYHREAVREAEKERAALSRIPAPKFSETAERELASYRAACEAGTRVRAARDSSDFDLGIAMANAGRQLDLAMRYLTTAENRIDRAHRELRDLRAVRLSRSSREPEVIDVVPIED